MPTLTGVKRGMRIAVKQQDDELTETLSVMSLSEEVKTQTPKILALASSHSYNVLLRSGTLHIVLASTLSPTSDVKVATS